MDSGWIVASSSLATIVATGLFSIWSKRIDAKHRVNEHKLTIRSAYINKKIDAGQVFIGKNTVRMNHLNSEMQYFVIYKIDKTSNNKLHDKREESIKSVRAIYYEKDNTAALYFNLERLNDEASELINDSNIHIKEFNAISHTGYTPELEIELNQIIGNYTKLRLTYRKMNDYVRDDLAKYDIL